MALSNSNRAVGEHCLSGQGLQLGQEREQVLAHLHQLVADVWAGFDHARDAEPAISDSVTNLLASPMPAIGGDPIEMLGLAAEVLNQSTAQARPRYLAYIGSSGLEIGAVADFLASSYDINMATHARAATALEEQTAAWLADFIGCKGFKGLFTSGGTMSNLTALSAARHRADPTVREHGLGKPLAVYCSAEAHYSNQRAIETLGLGRRSIRSIPVDSHHRMDPAALEASILEDLQNGITPMAIIATAGTTLTGAVDDLEAIARIAKTHGVWLHVDGAYGAPAAGSSAAGHLFKGLAKADSVTIDAHKWLFVPKACSIVLVKDLGSLASTFSHNEAYMPHVGSVLNPVDVTLEYSRPLRALKLWLGFLTHGANAFAAAIDGNLALAKRVYETARNADDFNVMAHAPQLSIVPVQYYPAEAAAGGITKSDFNRQLCDAIVADGRVFLSPGQIDGETWLRPCFTNFRTSESDVGEFFKVVRELGQALATKLS